MRFEFNRTGALAAAALAAAMAMAGGCETAGRSSLAKAVEPELSGDDPNSQMEFWHTLPDRRVTSNDEAFHALLLFLDAADASKTYDERLATLKSRGLLSADFSGPADAPVHRGTVAVLLANALHVKGGLTMRLFGATPRYATRELQYVGVLPPSSPQQTFSGAELLGVIAKAEDYQRQSHGADTADADPDAPAAPESAVTAAGE